MSQRNLSAALLLLAASIITAQDYAPFAQGNMWIFDIYESGSIVGTDTMRVEEDVVSGDTTFHHVYRYTTYTDGRPQEDPVLEIVYSGISDPNNVYSRTYLTSTFFIDLLYFKHQYVHNETFSNQLFEITSYAIGDYQVPGGTYGDCFWLKFNLGDSTGYVLAPDLGIVAAIEDGNMVRALRGENLSSTTGYDNIAFCNGDSTMLHGRYVSEEGDYRDTLQNIFGGDSIIITTVEFLPASEVVLDVVICEGDTYYAQGLEQSEPGTYRDTLVNSLGCDSVIVTNLNVVAEFLSQQEVTICEGDSYFAGGANQTEAGVYRDTLNSITGCDSIVITTLSLLPPLEGHRDAFICTGESFIAGGILQTEPGIYADTLVSKVTGCDSIRYTTLYVNDHEEHTVEVTICEGDSYFAGGTNQTEAGTYTDVHENSLGCDSTVHTVLSLENCNLSVPGGPAAESISIYPNPTNGILHVASELEIRYEVFNLLGKMVGSSREATFDFSTMPEGYYYIKCFHGESLLTVRKVIYQQ